jgi:hypothetical protein
MAMTDDYEGSDDFPLVEFVRGGPSDDGGILFIEALTPRGPVRLSIGLGDVQHLVSFLLVSAGKMTALSDGQFMPPPGNTRPIPATSISIGEPDGDEGYLGIEVGKAELLFAVPLSAFGPVARTMLTLSARPDRGLAT